MAYIPLKTVIEKTPFNNLKLEIIASRASELQIQIETEFDDTFFDLSVEEAIKLHKALDEFINDGALDDSLHE